MARYLNPAPEAIPLIAAILEPWSEGRGSRVFLNHPSISRSRFEMTSGIDVKAYKVTAGKGKKRFSFLLTGTVGDHVNAREWLRSYIGTVYRYTAEEFESVVEGAAIVGLNADEYEAEYGRGKSRSRIVTAFPMANSGT